MSVCVFREEVEPKNKNQIQAPNMDNNREVSRDEEDRRRFPPRFVVTLNQYSKLSYLFHLL